MKNPKGTWFDPLGPCSLQGEALTSSQEHQHVFLGRNGRRLSESNMVNSGFEQTPQLSSCTASPANTSTCSSKAGKRVLQHSPDTLATGSFCPRASRGRRRMPGPSRLGGNCEPRTVLPDCSTPVKFPESLLTRRF